MFESIRKRDGRIVPFDSSKITAAIAKAGKATGEFQEQEARRLTLKVLTLAHELRLPTIPEVEEVQDALERFREIIQQPHASLSDVGRHFGFSRQYASELYKKIYGRSYREVRQREREATNGNLKEMSKKPKQLKQVLMMKGKMESLGLAVRVHKKEHGYFLATNGHKVAVRFAATYRLRGRREYFQATNLKGAARFDYDFLIVVCIHGADQAYYVIPRHAVPENGLSLMPQANAKSKYSRFRDAWHLLAPKGA
jgi:hypothetical protein